MFFCRLRDLSAAEKQEFVALEKQLEKKSKELSEMSGKKEKLSSQLEAVRRIFYLSTTVLIAVIVDKFVPFFDKALPYIEEWKSVVEKTLDL